MSTAVVSQPHEVRRPSRFLVQQVGTASAPAGHDQAKYQPHNGQDGRYADPRGPLNHRALCHRALLPSTHMLAFNAAGP